MSDGERKDEAAAREKAAGGEGAERAERYQKKMLNQSYIRTACNIVIVVLAVIVVVNAMGLFSRLRVAVETANVIIADLEASDIPGTLAEIQTLVGEAQKTFEGVYELTEGAQGTLDEVYQLVVDAQGMVTSGSEGMEATLERIDSIDIETLNRAIDDLAAVIEPLARFFGR